MIRNMLAIVVLALTVFKASAQSYNDGIRNWQQHYKEEFLTDARSPLKAKDTGFLRFYHITGKWRVSAKVILTPDSPAFDMATHSGKTKRFRPYAILCFADPITRGLKYHTLIAYERINPPSGDTMSALSLFIPFNDLTNGSETYGGGRYIDLMKADVKGREILLDFNKAYNPWCAFGEGFSCPVPPVENRLKMKVRAGEKLPAPLLRAKE